MRKFKSSIISKKPSKSIKKAKSKVVTNVKKEAPKAKPIFKFPPSIYQKAIYQEIETGTENLIVNAVAGAGKTTTILNSMQFISSNSKVCFLAFNKLIANELKEKISRSNVDVSTFHSICLKSIFRKRKVNISSTKNKDIINANIDFKGQDMRPYYGLAKRYLGIAKNEGVGVLYNLSNTVETFRFIQNKHPFHPCAAKSIEDFNIDLFNEFLVHCLSLSLKDKFNIDFDDMLLYSLDKGIYFKKYDYIFVDEVQDLNKIQIAILKKMIRKGRLIAVGDPKQAIYGFRGSDSKSFFNVRDSFNCKELPLSVSYRCPKQIVKEAQGIVPHIKSGKSEEGIVERLETYKSNLFLNKKSAIISRKNSSLVRFAYELIANDVPCKILGKDISLDIVSFIKKFKCVTVSELLEKIDSPEIKNGKNRADDKIELVKVFYENLTKQVSSRLAMHWPVDIFTSKIEQFFDSCKDGILLSTVHKTKGSEFDTVFILNIDEFNPAWVVGDQKIQETHLVYVAITRAKKSLYYISNGRFQKEVI